jgi:hypothetical protein
MTLRNLRRRLERIEADRQPKLPPLILWHDGDDRNIQWQA